MVAPAQVSPSGPVDCIAQVMSVDPPNCLANITTELAVALVVADAAVGDYVEVLPLGALNAGVSIAYAYVSAAGAVQVAFGNATAGALNPVAQDMMVRLYKNRG